MKPAFLIAALLLGSIGNEVAAQEPENTIIAGSESVGFRPAALTQKFWPTGCDATTALIAPIDRAARFSLGSNFGNSCVPFNTPSVSQSMHVEGALIISATPGSKVCASINTIGASC
ncbi:MAG: hypothetical protein R3C42_01130 [Parvularculaceae bacterium]